MHIFYWPLAKSPVVSSATPLEDWGLSFPGKQGLSPVDSNCYQAYFDTELDVGLVDLKPDLIRRLLPQRTNAIDCPTGLDLPVQIPLSIA